MNKLRERRFSRVLCYPTFCPPAEELESRLRELRRLGVKTVEFTGNKRVFNLPVLGKGCVGVVIAALTDVGMVAMKIRRVDAPRVDMQREAEMLRRANELDVGPKLVGYSKNFLLMKFIEGFHLPQWIETLREEDSVFRIQEVLRAIFKQCYTLDKAGLDHGELSRAPKHIIVDSYDSPHLLDFEAASLIRKASNLTSICHYLILSGQVGNKIREKLGDIHKKELIDDLQNYKRSLKKKDFERIMELCNLRASTSWLINTPMERNSPDIDRRKQT